MSKLMKNKPRLGRGLSSLLSMSEPIEREISPESEATPVDHVSPSSPARAEIQTSPLEIPVASVVPNPHQPRKQMNDASIAELAASLKSTGLIQPIVVRPGRRNLRAHRRRAPLARRQARRPCHHPRHHPYRR